MNLTKKDLSILLKSNTLYDCEDDCDDCKDYCEKKKKEFNMNLSKENLLELLKSNILGLRDRSEEFATNPEFKKAWQKELNLINEEAPKLSAEDLKWLNDNYMAWSKENLLKGLDLSIKDNLPK